jgi:diphosphomevalonate decarboxylase
MTRATAHTNIALVKYWGKRPDEGADLNLPAVGSLSMTLAAYRTVTEVRPADADAFSLDGVELTGPPWPPPKSSETPRLGRARGGRAPP